MLYGPITFPLECTFLFFLSISELTDLIPGFYFALRFLQIMFGVPLDRTILFFGVKSLLNSRLCISSDYQPASTSVSPLPFVIGLCLRPIRLFFRMFSLVLLSILYHGGDDLSIQFYAYCKIFSNFAIMIRIF